MSTKAVPSLPAMKPQSPAEVVRGIKEQQAQECGKEIEAVLKKHGCILVGVPSITKDGRITAHVQLVAGE
jgi:predicted ATP-dependent serine protease